MRYASLFCLLSLNVSTLLGTDTITLTRDFTQANIIEFADYHLTPRLRASLYEIRQLGADQFESLRTTDGSFYSGDSVIWVKMILHNPLAENRDLVLQVRDVRINELQFFSIREEQIDSTEITGDYHPFAQRPVYHPFFLYPVVLQPLETREVYVLYRKIGETITLSTELFDHEIFTRKDRRESFRFTLFLGFLICITGAASLVALASRQKLLLSFAGYCIACLLMVLVMTGYGFMYLWPNVPYWNGLGYLFVIFYYLSMLQMTRIYMETKKYTPLFDQFFIFVQVMLITVFAPFVLSHWYLPTFWKVLVGRSGILLLLLSTAGLIIASIYIIHKKRTWGSFFFLLGFGFTILAVVLFSIEQIGSIDTFWGAETTLLFILLDFIILSIVFSNQIRQTFVRNTQLKQELTQLQLTAANALLEGQLEERRRLSRELHDGISIKMALLKMRLSQIFTQKTETEQHILSSVSHISEDIRAFTHAIAPLDLEEQSLEEAIEDLVFKIEQRTELAVQMNLNQLEEKTLRPTEKHAIYQTLQELFNNTIKHARASVVRIRIEQGNTFHLTYTDNGIGIDPESVNNGMGLRNIQARAQLLNGSFHMSAETSGSRFEFTF